MPDEQPKSSGGMVEQAVNWLRGQEFNNVMLFAILAAIFYGIPYALSQIQTGYEKQATTYDRAADRDHELIRGLLKNHGIDIPTSTRNMARRPE